MSVKMIQHNKPTIGTREYAAVNKVLRSSWIAEGREAAALEREFAKYLGLPASGAISVSSGTAALYVGLKVLGAGPGDQVIVPAYACSALLYAVHLCGADAVIADINRDDLNISLSDVRKKITRRTKAVILTHTFGLPADINGFLRLGIPVIEDCAQALGSRYNGKLAGSFGDLSIFSFYASKVITTGYGGMLVSRRKDILIKARDYLAYDDPKYAKYKPRFNFKMSDMQASIGRVQLKRLPAFLKRRRAIAEMYYKVLGSGRVWPPRIRKGYTPNFYRFLVRSPDAVKVKVKLAERGVKTIVPITAGELLHRHLSLPVRNFPASEDAARSTLSLPIYPSLSDRDVKRICGALTHV